MRIDGFAHAVPSAVREAAFKEFGELPPDMIQWEVLTTLFDVDLRLKIMDESNIDLQILTSASPPLEAVLDDESTKRLAVLTNDSMAAIVDERPDRFRGVATVPLIDVGWAIEELRRSVRDLGLLGALLYTSVRGRPLDAPEFDDFYTAVEELDVPIWLHPDRPQRHADYRGEERSRYGVYLVLGWPYETSVAMTRLVASGVMARHPRLKIIIHHAGAMIPFFARRFEFHYPTGGEVARVESPVDRDTPILDQFRRFYVDTVTQGSVTALMNSYELFGPDQMLFGSDVPFGPNLGHDFARVAAQSVDWMPIPADQRDKILYQNAIRVCGIRI